MSRSHQIKPAHAALLGSNPAGRPFLVIKPRQDTTGRNGSGVGRNVDLGRVGKGIQIALLRGEDRDVLKEGGANLLEDFVGEFAVVDVEIVRLTPEIV